MEANETNGKEVEDDAVRPKCDIDAEEITDNKIEENAVRPKSDMDAEAFDEVAQNNRICGKAVRTQEERPTSGKGVRDTARWNDQIGRSTTILHEKVCQSGISVQ